MKSGTYAILHMIIWCSSFAVAFAIESKPLSLIAFGSVVYFWGLYTGNVGID